MHALLIAVALTPGQGPYGPGPGGYGFAPAPTEFELRADFRRRLFFRRPGVVIDVRFRPRPSGFGASPYGGGYSVPFASASGCNGASRGGYATGYNGYSYSGYSYNGNGNGNGNGRAVYSYGNGNGGGPRYAAPPPGVREYRDY